MLFSHLWVLRDITACLLKNYKKYLTPSHRRREKGVNFEWTTNCQSSFDKINYLLISAPIMKLADLRKKFIVCTNACMEELEGFLLQDNSVIAYESRKLKGHEKNYVVYDMELAAVIHALKMWRHYLLGKIFTLVTDHFSSEYMLSQPDLNARKARWMAFPREFNFEITNMKEKENKVVGALSRHTHTLTGITVSSIKTNFLEKIKNTMHKDFKYSEMQQKLQQTHILGYAENGEKLLTYRGKFYIPNIPKCKEIILKEHHKNPFTRYFGY